jgi:hypothetical protein
MRTGKSISLLSDGGIFMAKGRMKYSNLPPATRNELLALAKKVKYYAERSSQSSEQLDRYGRVGLTGTLGFPRAFIGFYQIIREEMAEKKLARRIKELAELHGYSGVDYHSFPKSIRDALPL